LFAAIRRWRRQRIIERAGLDTVLWLGTLDRLSFLRGLTDDECARLRDTVILFLHEKSIRGAAGLQLDGGMRLMIAAQACILILNLDIDYYRGWVEIIVYPDEFVPTVEYTDEDGVVHVDREPRTGEAWLQGPVILSWADVAPTADGVNVVIHEFAHKLDMLNGDANGYPPLHAGMRRETWTGAFAAAYADFCRRVDAGEDVAIDPYAAENPAEFFAVMSEAFFETPRAVLDVYPQVYAQLKVFYRQDPAVRAHAIMRRNQVSLSPC
jgi:Mlc titration factor MtfA (ptsG expression regulator)